MEETGRWTRMSLDKFSHPLTDIGIEKFLKDYETLKK
jgi:transaldolase